MSKDASEKILLTQQEAAKFLTVVAKNFMNLKTRTNSQRPWCWDRERLDTKSPILFGMSNPWGLRHKHLCLFEDFIK